MPVNQKTTLIVSAFTILVIISLLASACISTPAPQHIQTVMPPPLTPPVTLPVRPSVSPAGTLVVANDSAIHGIVPPPTLSATVLWSLRYHPRPSLRSCRIMASATALNGMLALTFNSPGRERRQDVPVGVAPRRMFQWDLASGEYSPAVPKMRYYRNVTGKND